MEVDNFLDVYLEGGKQALIEFICVYEQEELNNLNRDLVESFELMMQGVIQPAEYLNTVNEINEKIHDFFSDKILDQYSEGNLDETEMKEAFDETNKIKSEVEESIVKGRQKLR